MLGSYWQIKLEAISSFFPCGSVFQLCYIHRIAMAVCLQTPVDGVLQLVDKSSQPITMLASAIGWGGPELLGILGQEGSPAG